ncbi:hypothetical protein MCAMS1_01701 [biofilm metagenome]
MKFSAATLSDVNIIATLHVESWQQAYRGLLPDNYLDNLDIRERETLWHEVIFADKTKVIKASMAGTVTGFICYGDSRDETAEAETAEIMAFYVAPEYWRRGIGTDLWRTCRDDLCALGYQTVTLWVMAGNQRAIGFYQSQGFQPEPGVVETVRIAAITVSEQRYRCILAE